MTEGFYSQTSRKFPTSNLPIIQAKASTTQREKTNERRDAHRHFFGWLPIAAYARPDGFSPVTRIVTHHFRKSQYDEDYSVYQAAHASKKDALAIFTPLTAFIRANHLDLLERCFKNCLKAFPILRMLRLLAIITVAPAGGKSQARNKTIHTDSRENGIDTSCISPDAVRFCREKNILKRQPIRQGYHLFARALQGLFSFRIAAILGSIDEKIELNRKKIAELEALAKTIYDYWFVQFDFPDKNGKPYKSSGGKMVWNEQLKREIPDGWEVKPLGEIAIFSNGINYTTENQKGKKYRIVNVRDISAANLFIHGRDLSEITLPSAFAEKYVIPANCILIARSGIPGAIRLIANPQDTLYCGFIIICRPTIADSRPYLTYFMKSLEGSGATHKDSSILNNVSQDMLKRIYIPIPDDVTLLSFKSLMDDLFENIISLQTGIEETTILRDTLLPLLMNGQVEVKE